MGVRSTRRGDDTAVDRRSASAGPEAAPRTRATRATSPRAATASIDAHEPARARRSAPPTADLRGALGAVLDEATTLRRSAAPEGRERLLSAAEAARFEALFAGLPSTIAERIIELVKSPRGEAAPVARALLVRAALARLPKLARSERPLATLEAFARSLRGRSADELLAKSTVLDLDSTKSTSALDPLALFERRGVVHARGHGDVGTNNDGLFQRFTASCGPTVIEMMVAQADPVFAFALHGPAAGAGVASSDTDDRAGVFQRELLEDLGGIALGLADAQLRARFRNAVGRLVADGALEPREAKALKAHVERRGPMTRAVAKGLALLRESFDGFPAARTISDLRKKKLPERDEGLGTHEFAAALARHVSPMIGTYYRPTNPPDGFARGGAWRHLEGVTRALSSGVDVPFGISEPAHWMLATAVEGAKPERRFLVSDPASGRTAWIAEDAFVRGTFVRDAFDLCTGDERGYIDVFFLPEAPR